MPELPEVETVRRGLEIAVTDRTIKKVLLRRGNLRTPFPPRFEAQLKGQKIKSISRRAKYLLIHMKDDLVLIIHLGMSGRLIVMNAPPKRSGKHDHVIITFANGSALVFNDARRFGLMALVTKKTLAKHPLLAHLGPEPLGKTFDAVYLRAQLKRRKCSVKQAIMDQELVVGVGNIYASEALYDAGVDPRKSAGDAAKHARAISASIRRVLRSAIASGGSSLRDFLHVGGETGYFQHRFEVYGREGKRCRACACKIQRIVQGSRSTFFCPHCQK